MKSPQQPGPVAGGPGRKACAGNHCSICASPALFLVQRARGAEPLCNLHFEWLLENSRRDPKFERVDPCQCGWYGSRSHAEARRRDKGSDPVKEAVKEASSKAVVEAGPDLEAKREYNRRWRERHPEKLKAQHAAWRAKQKAKAAAEQKAKAAAARKETRGERNARIRRMVWGRQPDARIDADGEAQS